MKFCETVKLPNGDSAVICHDLPRRKCQFCRARDGANQCDFQLGGPCRKCKGAGRLDPIELLIKEKRITREQANNPESFVRELAKQWWPEDLECHPCAGTGRAMCNKYFCGTQCGVRVSTDEGYCPDHVQLAGHSKKLTRERCEWATATDDGGKCLRQACNKQVRAGQRCLYFPERRRAMDATCGEQYLLMTETEPCLRN